MHAFIMELDHSGNNHRGARMKTIIKSQILDRHITFSNPGNYYIYADLNGQPGTLGRQICEAGCTMGSTMTYDGDSPIEFETICRRWYRAYLRNIKRMEEQ